MTTQSTQNSTNVLLGITAAAILVPIATASLIDINSDPAGSTEGIADFSGSLQYTPDAMSNQGLLTITLNNTSAAENSGYLTAFAFDLNNFASGTDISLVSSSHPFSGLTNAKAQPFGTYAAGASTGKNWHGGGKPHSGIAAGDTGVFEFLIASENAGLLSTHDFLNSDNSAGFVARFRGFADGGSDMVPAIVTAAAVPGPAAIGLLLIAGLAGPRRRR